MTTDLHVVVDDRGAAPPVVLLHSLAMDHTIWDEHVVALAPDIPTVRCDLPGHGRSGGVGVDTLERMAAEVAAALDALPWDHYVVTGLSLGGCVAQALAVSRPDLVAGLLLTDTTAWYGPDAVANWEERATFAATKGLDALSEFQLERWFSPSFRSEHPEVGEKVLGIFRANDVDRYAATCRAMGRFDARAEVSSIGVPTRVLVGELDRATPPAHAEFLADAIDGASLRVLPNASHMSPLELPDEVIDEIRLLHDRVRAAQSTH